MVSVVSNFLHVWSLRLKTVRAPFRAAVRRGWESGGPTANVMTRVPEEHDAFTCVLSLIVPLYSEYKAF